MVPGARVGPYEILARLGSGGMGEVWRARDERLGRNVAIKVLPVAFAADPERLARFEREARATAALSHPNVLAIFDVGIHDEQPYLVEELLEGESLRVRLLDGPLGVREALTLGVQIARGLAAAHDKRIVHRDLKPDNVIVTREGTAKILDFGLAKIVEPVSGDADTITRAPTAATGPGQVMGSAAYMAPEQARGLPVDHRADIFAFGVLLYELLSGRRPFGGHTVSDTMAAILKDEPASLPASVPSPVQAVILRCLEKKPEDRFGSASDLAFAIQALIESAPRTAAKLPDQERPYPGLAAFTEADATRFFGRDEEIAALWRKLSGRSLLALIGPSGVGKTSFIRAGVVPHATPGWRCLVATPGQAPFAALARELASSLAGDPEAIRLLVDFQEPEIAQRLVGRWRQRCDHGLIVVDQFEELFTLNGEDPQQRFAGLLGKLAALDGVHVLLSMRDDFFFSCHRLAPLAEVFQDVTPLGPPSADGLRRALVEPAKGMGFAFEDEGLVEEMLQAVEGERGALPLLAFAAAALWEERNKETKTLTRAAYEAIGGVAGALAQHAEATLDRAGQDKLPLVRELFRNLVTAQGTRAGRDIDELLTVFPEAERGDAREALARLVDARLLTAFEVEGPDGSRHDRVEIVHESLLTAWPRLVRWRSEDEGGAHLRDQLRQAAHLWEEKGRPEDLLWAGTSFQEYQVWRTRYPGGLSEVEEAFGRAMAAAAGRKRRRRRVAVAAGFAAVLAVAASLGVMWRRSAQETRQREAGQLLALGRVRLADSPNAALAYATASLERADNAPARRFAMEALWQGPTALFVNGPVSPWSLAWSPDGRWLALGSPAGLALLERDGSEGQRLGSAPGGPVGFTPDNRRLVALTIQGHLTERDVWSVPDGRLEGTMKFAGPTRSWLVGDRLLAATIGTPGQEAKRSIPISALSLDGSVREDLGAWRPKDGFRSAVGPTGTWIAWLDEGRVLGQRLDALAGEPRELGSHGGEANIRVGPSRDRAITCDREGGVRIWDLAASRLVRALESPAGAEGAVLDPTGQLVATAPYDRLLPPRSMYLFDLAAPRMAEPAPLLENDLRYLNHLRFSPDGSWLASVHGQVALLWNMRSRRSVVLGRERSAHVGFADAEHLLSVGLGGVLRRWQLDPERPGDVTELWSRQGAEIILLELAPGGRFVALDDSHTNKVVVVPLDGSAAPNREPAHLPSGTLLGSGPSWDPSGRSLAMSVFSWGHPELNAIHVFDRTTGTERVLETQPTGNEGCAEPGSQHAGGAAPVWLRDGRLLSEGDGGLRVWDLLTGTSRQLRPCRAVGSLWSLLATPDSRAVIRLDASGETAAESSLSVFDLSSGATREIASHGGRVSALASDPSGAILVTGDKNGIVRVGSLAGDEPHLLFGHTAAITSVAVSPDGRRIASGSEDGTIRLWPMPDLSRPPLHTLPHAELLVKLRSLTNLRAVRDPSSDTGWKVEIDAFPGWANVPEW